MPGYDIVAVGGGLGGAALACAMAQRGSRVLVVEREKEFRDRVRGELMFPWGVAEAAELGVYEALMEAGGYHPPFWTVHAGPAALPPRNLAESTPQGLHALCIYHPPMQEALLQRAERGGAEVRRGARVRGLEPGREPRVHIEAGGGVETVSARLVVGADGRSSMVRKWGGFEAHDDPPGNIIAGVLVEGSAAEPESNHVFVNPFLSRLVLYFPQGKGRARAYLASRSEGGVRVHGDSHFGAFAGECVKTGMPAAFLDGAKQAGPLATFECAESWVGHPYREGVALVGDAAATSDPAWGQGLSLTLRDVRALRDALLADEDWDAAGHAYAAAHDAYFSKLRTSEAWFSAIFMESGPEADALRLRVLPKMVLDPGFLPDTFIAGPEQAPPTEEQRTRIFGDGQAG
jgi:2-polyprenyl-6-methoxyphenol hydroxylase-like FAD-dependent oxidoreductase